MNTKWIVPLEAAGPKDRPRIGGKGYALHRLQAGGFPVPPAVCVTTALYRAYLSRSGVGERILMELNRKQFNDLRWEEIWDSALRIRNLFLRKGLPRALEAPLRESLHARFGDAPVAVRSSAPEEDAAAVSFAGLHESFVNVCGAEAIIESIRKVWASLWSDAALLYRQELKLGVDKSAMAVVVQQLVSGRVSGVAFSHNPVNPAQGVVEAVHGLNQGLVDGAVPPDRWLIDRQRRRIVGHTAAERRQWAVADRSGVGLENLPAALGSKAPLNATEVLQVFDLALAARDHFGAPQDVEWTFADRKLHLLQSRPITGGREAAAGDQRGWYLSLRRSFDNLKELRSRIEVELIPAMVTAADELAAVDLSRLDDAALATEIRRRTEINSHWVGVYWAEFIPYAHGVRLFGQVYNDSVHPEDPYEFLVLLGQTPMAGLERNRLIAEMADLVRATPGMAAALQAGEPPPAPLDAKLTAFIDRFGDLSCPASGARHCTERPETLINVILQMAALPPSGPQKAPGSRAEDLKTAFLGLFSGAKRRRAEEMLDLARSSYQLRDDDNIHLGRIEARLTAALQEARRRLAPRIPQGAAEIDPAELLLALENPLHVLRPEPPAARAAGPAARTSLRARQLVGQPAGPGVARGPARVILTPADLAAFQAGEVLVCDAVDPNMTFFAPLSAGVVERRGGMLIHGAIIAREYGLPCVTGVPDATGLIRTGDELTVDGFLGIVTVATGRL
ncbi:MAG: PEP/pyruvate-binding domain-containing protein [Desulfobacteraceae bacterium]|jgi:pyruvate,water dikinase